MKFFILFVWMLFVFSCDSQNLLPSSEYECFRVKNIQVDGVLEDLEWKTLPEISFVLEGGKKPKRETKAKLAWNEKFLFMALWVTDDEILASQTNRDEPIWKEEVVELFLKPNPSMQHYFEIEFNALGACTDYFLSAPHNAFEWDSHVEWKVKKNAKTWQLEAAIPFSALYLTSSIIPKEGVVWTANLFRIEKSGGLENSYWSPLNGYDPDFHQPDKFGKLIFREKLVKTKNSTSKLNPKF